MFERLSAATVRPDSSSDDRPVHCVLRRCVRIASPASFAHNAEPGLDSNGERLLAGTTFFPSQFARIKMPLGPSQASGADADAILTLVIHGPCGRLLPATFSQPFSTFPHRVRKVVDYFRYGDRMWLNIALE